MCPGSKEMPDQITCNGTFDYERYVASALSMGWLYQLLPTGAEGVVRRAMGTIIWGYIGGTIGIHFPHSPLITIGGLGHGFGYNNL